MNVILAQRLFEEAAQHYEHRDSKMSKVCTGLAQLAEAVKILDERLQRIEKIQANETKRKNSALS